MIFRVDFKYPDSYSERDKDGRLPHFFEVSNSKELHDCISQFDQGDADMEEENPPISVITSLNLVEPKFHETSVISYSMLLIDGPDECKPLKEFLK